MVRNWGNEEGLPHSIINSIVQTHDGYLWIATYVGLVRFDGVRFVHLSPSTLPELGSGRISKLFEDRAGTLWIALESGRLLAFKDGVARIHLPDDPVPNQPIVQMVQDAAGVIWLQTANGRLGRLTAGGVDFVANTGPFPSRNSLGLVVDRDNRLWAGTRQGIKVWQKDRLMVPTGCEGLAERPVDSVAPARDGSVWVFRDQHLQKIDMSGVLETIESPGEIGEVTVALEAADGQLWLAAQDGNLFCLRTRSGKWETLAESGLLGPNRALCEDHEGNVWRGSFGGGLARIHRKLFTLHEFPAASLDRYTFTVTADAGGDVWALLNSRTLARIPANTKTPLAWSGPPIPQTIRTLWNDRRHLVWAGTDNGYLYQLRDGAFTNVLRVDKQAELISALFEDSHSNLWVGFTQGAGVGVLPEGDPGRYHVIEGMPFPDVRCIAEAADGAMWFGTHYGGACRWQGGRWTRLTMHEGLPSDYVRCLHAEPDGSMWLGTLMGLCRWREGNLTSIKSDHGLWNDSISHLAADGRGNFWMSSFGGVFRVKHRELEDFAEGRRQNIQCVGYNRSDGLPNLECPGGFQPAGTRTADGRLWFPTIGGLVSIDPAEVCENTLVPPVWLEEVTVDGASYPIHPLSPALTVAPGKRRFEFRFSALSLSAPEKVRFRHKIERLDTDWSQPSPQRTVGYSYIPPGHYTVRVTACNNDGVWNEAGQSLQLVVQPFFWQTWWFKAAVGSMLAIALALSVRQVERWSTRLRFERLQQQHAIEHERSRIAKDIHDDLGAHLTQIIFLSQRAEASSSNSTEVEHWIRQIPATARRTIRSLDEIVWAINPRHDTLESLANYLSQFAQDHLTLAGVRCLLEVPTVLPSVALGAEVRHNLVLAAREAIQNAVAHAAATDVRVGLELADQELWITIADNGRGFDTSRPSPDGNGLQNMRRRLEDIGGRITIESQPGSGTTVTLAVPRASLHGRVIAPEPSRL